MYKYALLFLTINCFAFDTFKECSRMQRKEFSDCHLVTAIAIVESNQNPNAINKEGTTSYGLMQVQCSTAIMLGFRGDCKFLLRPFINLKYALRYLGYQKKRYDNLEDIIASYNSGSVIKRKGDYINREYVDKVLRLYKERIFFHLALIDND